MRIAVVAVVVVCVAAGLSAAAAQQREEPTWAAPARPASDVVERRPAVADPVEDQRGVASADGRRAPVVAEPDASAAPDADADTAAVATDAPLVDGDGFVTRTAQPADAFADSVGVNTHLHYSDTVYVERFDDVIRPRLVELGVAHIRDHAYTGPDHDADHFYYRRLRTLAADGFEFSLVTDIADRRRPETRWDQLDEVVEWSGGAVWAFEGPNEPDGFSQLPERQWVARTRDAQQDLWAAAQSDPALSDVQVVAPSLVRWRDSWDALGDLSAFSDLGNWHRYPGGVAPADRRTLAAEEGGPRVVSGDQRLVVTETGYHNATASRDDHRPATELDAAAYIPVLLLEHFSRGYPRTYLYELIDQRADRGRSDREANFGLLRNDGSPKPAFTALRNLLSALGVDGPADIDRVTADSTSALAYRVEGAGDDVRTLLLERDDGAMVLALWRTEVDAAEARRQPEQVVVRLASPATRVGVIDPLRSAAPVDVRRDAADVAVTLDDTAVLVAIEP